MVCHLALLWRRTWIIFLFGRTFLILCLNFFNVHKYCSEMTVARLSSNSTNKIPSLSQKRFPMTLSAEARTLNFFLQGDGWCCHSTALYQWGIMMNPVVSTSNYVWQKSTFVFLTILTKFCKYVLWALLCSMVNVFGTHFVQTLLSQVLWWWP
jgi:hypothetical protein